jgi:hypothetical protein
VRAMATLAAGSIDSGAARSALDALRRETTVP